MESRTVAEAFAAGLEPADLSLECVIYLIVCTANGKGYVGQSYGPVRRRWKSHRANSENLLVQHVLARAMRKYGLDTFSIHLIESCAKNELDDRETYWIEQLATLQPTGYNMRVGGGVKARMTPEVGEKISQALEGRVVTWGDKISASTKGIPKNFSPEAIEILRENGKRTLGRMDNEETRRKKSAALKGRPRGPLPTDAARNAKIAETLRGRKLSAETIAKRSAKQAGKKWYTNSITEGKFLPGEEPPGWINKRLKMGKRPALSAAHRAVISKRQKGIKRGPMTQAQRDAIRAGHTPEGLERSRQAATGRKRSAEAIERTRQANLGRKRSEITRQLIREARAHQVFSEETNEKRRQTMIATMAKKFSKSKDEGE